MVYYFIVVHQSAEPGREADVADDTDRPTTLMLLVFRLAEDIIWFLREGEGKIVTNVFKRRV